MPEFIMPLENRKDVETFNSLPKFTQGYIEAMFFTECYSGGDLEGATFAELAPETLAAVKQDCAAFIAANRADLDEAIDTGRIDGYNEQSAGRDYWYTRNGHGVGFWDRGLGEIGDKLSNAARYSEVNLYRGDDELLYLS